jgi:flavodoxin I
MSKVAVVYWSGTGNTKAMADAVVSGASGAGADTAEFGADEFSSADVSSYDAIAFGCPAMGTEVLEESVFQPMWDDARNALKGKKIALFGSWGWGGGAWMDSWQADASSAGADVIGTATANNAPDDAALEECKALGKQLAS